MFFNNGTGHQSGLFCTTPACMKMATQILTGLADNYTKIDPCVNFDQLTCQGWDMRTQVPAGETSTDPLALVTNSNRLILKDILEKPYPNGQDAGWITTTLTPAETAADRDNFHKMQNMYSACMNITAQAEAGIRPLIDLAAVVSQIYPIHAPTYRSNQSAEVDRSASMGLAISYFEAVGIQVFTNLGTQIDDYNPDATLVSVNPGGVNSMLANETAEVKLQYVELGAEFLQSIYPGNISRQTATSLMTSVHDLEMQLLLTAGQALVDFGNQWADSGIPSPKMTLDALGNLAPELNLTYVVKAMAPEGFNHDRIVVNFPTFYPNMSRIISNTSSETMQAFLIWKAVTAMAPYVISNITDRYNEFQYQVSAWDPSYNGSRWQQCVEHADSGVYWMLSAVNPAGLGWITSRFFVDRAYSRHARKFTDQILTSIQQEFITRLHGKKWVSDLVKGGAEQKVKKILRKIGYPDISPNVTDPIAIQTYYSDVNITGSHFWNSLSLARSAVRHTWAQLSRPTDRNLWQGTAATANAYYNPPTNEIVVYAGIQQFPVYQDDFPAYLSYGGMGSICGHELTHGFDTQGRLYDGDGNLTNWWDAPSIEAFDNRTNCFIDQYSNFTTPGPNGTALNVNGYFTLAENIADSGGVQISYGAWQKVQAAQTTPDLGLPGLEHFSNEQLFFIQWAQTWCAVEPPAAMADQIATDVHAPGFARIRGPLANSRGFREAFNCPVKEPTCELW